MKKFFIDTWDKIRWITRRNSSKMYVVTSSSMKTLVGMECVTGKPKKGGVSIFTGDNIGYRSVYPILVRKLKEGGIEIFTKTERIKAKRTR